MNVDFNIGAPNLKDLLNRFAERQFRRDMATSFAPTVTLYDQFGRPVLVPSTAKKIGNTLTVQRPARFRQW